MKGSLFDDFRGCGCQLIERLLPRIALVPEDEVSISKLVGLAARRRLRICPLGTGSSFPADYNPLDDLVFLLTGQMNQLLQLEPHDAVAVVETGMLAAELGERLRGTDWDFPAVLAEYPGTMGGAIFSPDSTGLRQMELRRRLLGIEIVDPRGRLLKFGGRTVKNVAGYDFWTLLVGTGGRFGVLTRLTLNLEKMPPLREIPPRKPDSCPADNPSQWIFANMSKRLDPYGIFVR